MSESQSTFRSKYAGMPGSLVAIRVDYARRSAAFDGYASEDVSHTKRDVKRWKMGHRLGDKAEWNTSAQPDGYVGGAPQRANLRQLSEFQGVKLEYNFRASTLPDVNKTTRFVPKPSKLQVDRSIFLPPKERALLVRQNVGTTTLLSRREMNNDGVDGVERETGWNTSASLDKERTDIYKLRGYEDFREINKTKSVLDHGKYVTPQRRQLATIKAARDEKLQRREAEGKARMQREATRSAPSHLGGSSGAGVTSMGPVYKMSNIDHWWDEEFDSKMVATASAVLGRPISVEGVKPAGAPAGEAGATSAEGGAEGNDGSAAQADP